MVGKKGSRRSMRIALISYEYPPDTADGGVATYVGQAALMLAKRGHSVEVFAGSRERTQTSLENGITVHRINADQEDVFRAQVAPLFAERHALSPFAVVEAPEWRADAAGILNLVPDIPLVIRLHTPTYLLSRLNTPPITRKSLIQDIQKYVIWTRVYVGALRRGRRVPWRLGYERYLHEKRRLEYALTHCADEIVTPSVSLGQIVAKKWRLNPDLIHHVPNLYVASEQMLSIPVETQTHRITFLGRLELRKGVLDLARAIPLVLRRNPHAKFRFVGRPRHSPDPHLNMRQYLERKLARFQSSVEFCDPVPLQDIPNMLAETDICVFPSLWENFPNVCLEAMSSGRGVIGSSAGGMLDMLEDGKYGLNVPPRRPFALSEAINSLLADPARRQSLGRAARQKVVSAYNLDRIGTLQEESYARAIARRHSLGSRQMSQTLAVLP